MEKKKKPARRGPIPRNLRLLKECVNSARSDLSEIHGRLVDATMSLDDLHDTLCLAREVRTRVEELFDMVSTESETQDVDGTVVDVESKSKGVKS